MENPFIEDLKQIFTVTSSDIKKIIADFHSEMKRGLSGQKSSLKMIPSFVARPNGTEKGRYLALDLGGTNLRILAVELDGRGNADVVAVDKFVIKNSLMQGTGDALFDFIAQCVADFLRKNKIDTDCEPNLAFTFSFPVDQTGIAAGRLIAWTKGFSATGVVGKDVVTLFGKALARKGLSAVKTVALVNDTVGTLVAKNYSDRSCDMGVILGTGTNACYPEKTANITKNKDLGDDAEMIISMEWGNFSKLTQTSYDIDLDKDSLNVGVHFLEKMVSGMYLGEIVRRVMNTGRSILPKKYSFKTEHMSLIASDDFSMLPELGLKNISAGDKKMLKEVCRMVALRSARISAAAMAAVISWMDPKLENSHTVGIDGSLFEKYPYYKENIIAVFNDIFGTKSKKIKLAMAKDGSGIGAAIIAAIASS